MSNDIETAEEKTFKVHKLPTRPCDQATLAEEIEAIWTNCDRYIEKTGFSKYYL